MFVRSEHKSKYTCIDNSAILDKDLPLSARGLFAVILSLPDDWSFSVSGLASITGASKGAIEGNVKKLEERGYIERVKGDRGEDGQFTKGHWVIYEQCNHNPKTGVRYSSGQIQENPSTEPQPKNGGTAANWGNANNPQVAPQPKNRDTEIGHYKVSKPNNYQLNKEEQNTVPFYRQCLDALNEELGTNFSDMPRECKDSLTRFQHNYDLESVREMVRYKSKEWTGTRFQSCLRPKTLFSLDHFEEYVNLATMDRRRVSKNAKYAH